MRLSQAGVPSILIEAGGGLPPASVTVERAVHGVRNVHRRLGSLAEPVVPARAPRVLHGFRIVTPSRGGFVQDGVVLGQEVEEGERRGHGARESPRPERAHGRTRSSGDGEAGRS